MIEVFDIISQMQEEKKNNRIIPCHITVVDLKNRVYELMSQELNQLINDGKVKKGKTISHTTYFIPDG